MRGGWVERGTVLIRLTRPHFAFYRGYLDNVDLRTLAGLYLENVAETGDEETDLRIVRSSVKWIREQLVVAARRARISKAARLLKIKPESLRLTHTDVPTLEEFREERDPHEMYSEEDLLAFFQEEYGATERQTRLAERNDRLRRQQRTALAQLEELADADPKLADRVDGWLDPMLAKRLHDAGIHTLAELIAKIHAHGYRWYSKVPRVGEKAAVQIVRWLTTPAVSDALGVTLHVRGMTRRRDLPAVVPALNPPRTDIVPLEEFLLPAELDGSNGTNRGERSLLAAADDLKAVKAWLSLAKPGSHTYRSYRKEAERFLLWCIMEKRKPLSSVTIEDCRDYRDFLWYLGSTVEVPLLSPARLPAGDHEADPRASATYKKPPMMTVFETEYWHTRFTLPQQRWIGPHSAPRWSELWRPFEGRLSPSSQSLALVVVKAMMQWLTDQHYLHGNPMKAVKPLTAMAEDLDPSRALSKAEWAAVKTYLATLKRENDTEPDDRKVNDTYVRLRFILALAYSTGMRLSELTSLRKKHVGSFVRLEDGVTCWMANVVGKGQKKRTVQLNRAIMDELNAYFVRRGHRSFLGAPGETPIVAALPTYKNKTPEPGTADDPLTDQRLYKVLKRFFAQAADHIRESNREMAEKVQRASTHWLRHTYATHALEAGMSLEVVRDLLGHASIDTTSIYVNAERDRSSKEAEEMGPAL